MGKNKSAGESTVENRVYLFKDLATAFLAEQSDLLIGTEQQRQLALRALSDIAHACCVLADSEALDEDEVAHLVKTGPVAAVVDDSDVVLESTAPPAKKRDAGGKAGKKGGGKKAQGKAKAGGKGKAKAGGKGKGKGKGNGGSTDEPIAHKDLPGRRGWGGGHGGG